MIFHGRRMPDCRYYEGQDLEALADLPGYHDWVLELFRPHLRGKVIEIGAGLGNVAWRYADSVQELLLVEPAQNLHARLKQRFEAKPHVRTVCALIQNVRADGVVLAPFDAALMVNVLEHVVDDQSMLRSIRAVLRPEGALLLFVPALPWLYGALDKRVGHERRYTLRGLCEVVERAGFSIETIRYFDLPGILPWLVAGRLGRSGRFSDRAAKLYDRLIVPLARGMERYIRPPIGKNLVCIARAAEGDDSGGHRSPGNAATS